MKIIHLTGLTIIGGSKSKIEVGFGNSSLVMTIIKFKIISIFTQIIIKIIFSDFNCKSWPLKLFQSVVMLETCVWKTLKISNLFRKKCSRTSVVASLQDETWKFWAATDETKMDRIVLFLIMIKNQISLFLNQMNFKMMLRIIRIKPVFGIYCMQHGCMAHAFP